MIRHPNQRVGVFIDTQNMYYSARHLFNRKVNFGNIVKDAVADGQLLRAIAYVVRTKSSEESPFFEALQKIGIELREKNLMEYFSGHKKADWDVGLTVDVIRMLDMLDVIVIASGDGDFLPLVKYVQSRGRMIEIMAFRETTSSKLVEEVDAFTNLSDNKRKYLIGSGTLPQKRKESEPIIPESINQTVTQNTDENTNFFMNDSVRCEDDQEERRRNRLSF